MVIFVEVSSLLHSLNNVFDFLEPHQKLLILHQSTLYPQLLQMGTGTITVGIGSMQC